MLYEVNGQGAVTAWVLTEPLGVALRAVRGRGGFAPVLYLCDAQGDVLLRLDGEGRITSADAYDAWGLRAWGGAADDPYGYKAQCGYRTARCLPCTDHS